MGTKKTGPCFLEPLLLGWKLSMNDKSKSNWLVQEGLHSKLYILSLKKFTIQGRPYSTH